ncbi:hypothetical protein CFC21_103473 [Triticum aestivum]|uniref:Uncharacterized protein n=3 Tax=Triticum TaxID=4564 RepID=A0A9R1A3G7_TRITD|nr:hypothetical protein CFC21_103473 [Triticum aestivum]VAI88879.1 unnamed protein product [Triticum turgidum subsp. durum]
MASSRVAVLLFLVCTLGVARKMEAARMMHKGEVVLGNGGGGGGGGNALQHGLVDGHRPRHVASFTTGDDVVEAPSSQAAGGDGAKREVPGGPDPIHHHGSVPPTSVAP